MSHKAGWAFGLGLERLAMVLFSIPDIRLFWSPDPRFLSQFAEGQISSFQPYSKYPPCYRDMSFWIPEISPVSLSTEGPGGWHENDYCEIVRDVAGDLIETVEKAGHPCVCGVLTPDRRVHASQDEAGQQDLPLKLPQHGQVR